MPRAGYLILVALLLAATAAGVLVWTKYLEIGKSQQLEPIQTSSTAPVNPDQNIRETQLVAQMLEATSQGGHAATFAEKDEGKWKIADGHRLERFSLNASGPVFARLSSGLPRDKPFIAWSELGLSWEIPRRFAQASNGKPIEIGIVARQSKNAPAPSASVIFATRQSGNSEWRKLNLTEEFALTKFSYVVPPAPEGYTVGPMIVLNSDVSGNGAAVEILGAYVKLSPSN